MQAGEKLGKYEIREKIGQGGMGEVFLAYDPQLDRDVVLKLLLGKFVQDEDLVQRFKLEAKAVSALNHPNIITIHEIVEIGDLSFIVYEHIKGHTLRDKIKRNKLTINECVNIVEQIAKGLLAAHNAGIIHRDIKPENIMIREDGYVKILDFGLAKKSVFETDSEGHTAPLVETKEGMIMGSVQYMSPEQARGEKMDERTDIWSLGVCFYEMLTGISPFAGNTLGDSIALVLQSKPKPPIEINKNIPNRLQTVIGKSLEKDRNRRYSEVSVFLSDLDGTETSENVSSKDNETLQYDQNTNQNGADISTANTFVEDTQRLKNAASRAHASVETASSAKPKRWKWAVLAVVPVALISVALLAVIGFGGWYYYSTQLSQNIPFKNSQSERLTKDQVARFPAISPDGKMIAYVRNRDGKQILTIRQSESDGETDLFEAYADSVLDISFTPKGDAVNFVLQDHGLAMVFQIPAIGGEPKILVQDVRSNVTYSPDGKRFAFLRFDIGNKLSKVIISNSDGSDEKELINTKDSGFVLFKDLAWSPDGKNLLMVVLDGRQGKTFKYNLGTIPVDALGKAKPADKFEVLEKDGCCVVSSVKWLKDGSGVIMLSRKQEDKTRQIYFVSYPDGRAHRLTNDASNYSWIDVNADGTKIIAGTEKVASGIWEVDLQSKQSKQLSAESEELDNITDIAVNKEGNVFYSTVDLAKGTCNVSYFDPKVLAKQQYTLGGCVRGVSFSPDGKYFLSSVNLKGKGQQSIMRFDIDARNPAQLTNDDGFFDYLPQPANGGTIFFNRLKIDGSFPKLMKVSVDGGKSETVFENAEQLEIYPKISPDGKYLAYNEFKKGDLAPASSLLVKVVEIVDGKVGETVYEIKVNQPVRFGWTKDSRNLVFIDPVTLMNVIRVSVGNMKESTLPVTLENLINVTVTDFNSQNIYGPPAFSVDGNKMYVIRTAQIRDLILITDDSRKKK